MKNSIIIALFLCFGFSLSAQQEPLFTQYYNLGFAINPAVAGSMTGHQLRLFHRWQWVTFPGAPLTYGMTYTARIKGVHGIGAMLYSDRTGPTSRIGAKLAYAFHIPIGQNRLSLGLAGRYQNNRIKTDIIRFIQDGDPAVANGNQGVNTFDAEFGAYFYNKKFYAGIAAPNLIQTKMDFGVNADARSEIAKLYRHYFAYAGYRFDLGKIALEPSVMVKYVVGTPVQVDAGLRLHFLDDQLSVGAAWRSPQFMSFYFRALIDRKFPITFSFDIATTRFQNYSLGSNEVILGWNIPDVPEWKQQLEIDVETPSRF
jgi:type IX secretion system PorP/SprF family membrane protein